MPSQSAVNAALAFLIIAPIVLSILIGLLVGVLARLAVKSTRRIPSWQMILSSVVGAYVFWTIGVGFAHIPYGLALIVVGAVVGAATIPAIRRHKMVGH
jgi:uncharacterized membrane protein YeaQ/YmgE (transglycosylase-associated protein family)